MQPSTPQGWEAVNNAYRAVKDYPLPDQVIAAAFNRTRDEALAYLQEQIAGLRFPTTR